MIEERRKTSMYRMLKLLLWLLPILYCSMFFFFRISEVQNRSVDGLEKLLSSVMGTKLSIGQVSLHFLDFFHLQDVYIEDVNQDTFLFVENAFVDFSLTRLIARSEIEIQSVKLKGVTVNLKRLPNGCTNIDLKDKSDHQLDSSEEGKIRFVFNPSQLKLRDFLFEHDKLDRGSKERVYVSIADLWIDSSDFLHAFHFRKAKLKGVHANIVNYEEVVVQEEGPAKCPLKNPDIEKIPLLVTCGNLQLGASDVHIDNELRERLSRDLYPGVFVDFNHLFFERVEGGLHHLRIHGDTVDIRGLELRGNTEEGVEIRRLHADRFLYHNQLMDFQGFSLETPTSILSDRITMKYNSMMDFGDFENKVFLDCNVENSKISVADLMVVAPKLYSSKMFTDLENDYFYYDGVVKGRVNNLLFQKFEASLGTLVSTSGNLVVRNAASGEELYLNLGLDYARAWARDVQKYFPDVKWPDGFSDLGYMNFEGRFVGPLSDWVSTCDIYSDLGKGAFDIHVVPRNKTYEGKVALVDFDLGSFFGIEDVGCVTTSAQVSDGSGFTLETIDARVQGELEVFEYKGYTYHNGRLDGRLRNEFFSGMLEINDDYMDMTFSGKVDLGDENPQFKFTSQVDNIDLQALHLSDRPIKIKGDVEFDILGKELDKINGKIALSEFVVSDEFNDAQQLDSMLFEIISGDGNYKKIGLVSEPVKAEIEGVLDLKGVLHSVLGSLYKEHPKVFSTLHLFEEQKDVTMTQNDFRFRLDLSNGNDLLRTVLSGIDTSHGMTLSGDFANDSLGLVLIDITAETEVLTYKSYSFMPTVLRLTKEGEAPMSVDLRSEGISLGSTFFESPTAHIDLLGDEVFHRIHVGAIANAFFDVDMVASMVFNGTSDFAVHIDTSSFMLLDRKWSMDTANQISFSPQSLWVDNFIYRSDESNFYIQSVTDKSLIAGTVNLNSSFLNDMIQNENLKVGGNIYMNLALEDVFEKKGYEIEVSVEDLRINDDAYEYLGFNAYMRDLDRPVKISGDLRSPDKSLLMLAGTANMKGENGFTYEIDVHLDELPLSSTEVFLGNLISETNGFMSSDLRISGVGSRYDIEGGVELNGRTFFTLLGTELLFDKQVVTFQKDLLRFDGIRVGDGVGNFALVNGELRHQNFQNMNLDLRAQSIDAFRVLDTRYSPGVPFYGTAFGKVDVDISGPTSNLSVRVDAASRPGTNVIIPISFYTSSTRNFFYQELDSGNLEGHRISFLRDTSFNPTGIELDLNIDINTDAYVQMIFGTNSEDRLEGTGTGDISISMDRNGEINMYGVYEVYQGVYNFAAFADYGISRNFSVSDGGQIVWSGDPLDALINIDAIYKVRASPYPFVAELVTTDNIRQLADNVTDVNLFLSLQGSLVKPDLTFDFGFPDVDGPLRNIVNQKNTSLRDNEGEKTIQAASLLTFNAFTQSGQTNFGSSVANTAYDIFTGFASSSFTDFIQTNLLRDIPWITGFSTSFAVKSLDDTFGEGENPGGAINYVESNSVIELFNRWQLTYRPRRDQRLSSGRVLHDLISEYYLKPDKSLSLSLYYKSTGYQQFGDIRQKLGTGISFSKSYNSLSEVFSDPDDQQETIDTIR